MKIYNKLISGGLAIALLAGGCVNAPAPPAQLPESSEPLPLVSSEPASQNTSSEAVAIETQNPREVPAPLAELPQQPELYLYIPDTGLYERQPYTPPENATLADLALDTAVELKLPVQIKEITQQKGMIVVDFKKDAPPVIGTGSGSEAAVLDSIAMTILQNHSSAGWVCYRVDGGVYESGHFAFGIDEEYPVAPLKLVEDTPDEYAKIRVEIPFPGLPPADDRAQLPIETDATGKELAWALTLIGAPDKDIASAAELDNDFMIKQALQAAPLLDGSETWLDASDPLYQPSLKPIAAAVEDGQMTLREHVEEAARLLYGDSVKLTHGSVMGEKWKWHEKEGVYTPPHMGGGMTVAAVLEYEQTTSKRYRVKCVFVRMSAGGMADDNGDLITEAEFNNAIQTRVRQREMVLQRNEDDGFSLISHRFLP